ncbi:hypothetical protein [Noviherbaspirillum humi]|uniref:hypothetical protein n=1 Tax=Noviherbaspirillum humi TaxID=1688639 RepID=UPI0011605BB6|nr:hypothetical protein [Noviherbaspirillum humi]
MRRFLQASLLAASIAASSNALAVAAMPTTGSCAVLGNFVYSFAYQYGATAGPGWGLNILASIDFSTNTLKGVMVLMNPNASASKQANIAITAPLTVTAMPTLGNGFQRIEGTATVTGIGFASGSTPYATGVTVGDTFPISFNAVPVNNSNTLLLQMRAKAPGSADGTWTGVCQF